MTPSGSSAPRRRDGGLGLDVELRAAQLDRLLEPQADLGLVELGALRALALLGQGALSASARSRRRPSSWADSARWASVSRRRRSCMSAKRSSTSAEPVADERRQPVERPLGGVELDPAVLGLAARRDRAGQALLDLGRAGGAGSVAVGERGAALVEVGAAWRPPAAACSSSRWRASAMACARSPQGRLLGLEHGQLGRQLGGRVAVAGQPLGGLVLLSASGRARRACRRGRPRPGRAAAVAAATARAGAWSSRRRPPSSAWRASSSAARAA